ncbi:zinc finger BED domain-containing protein RICESLEEPER 2-like [Nicotiana tabacum]|uniref:Zinc finger BED domain-containing protein RICESLEEPER 2-like n=1 Tax=Nicotiana tabacum TaxID=4097 RepID=A0AC58S7P9_TOBAC
MAKVIGNCLLEWKLDKVFIVTVDNASSNDVTKIDISVKCVRQAVRWNFTYLMLEITQNFEKAFDKLHLFYDGFSTHLCMHVCEDGNVAGPFVCDDWVNMRNVIKFLERFHKLSEKVSGSRYVTSNCHFEDICELDSHLKACLVSDYTNLSKMAGRMKEKFKKYWGEPEKMNKIIFIAFVIDPHNKLEYVGFALEKMFGEEPGKKLTAEVDAYLNSLFGDGNVRTKYVRTKQLLKRQKEDSESVGAKSELERYIGEGQEPLSDDSNDFKILDCIGGRILDSFRSSLTPRLVQSLVCVQDWFRCEGTPINVEEDLEFLEQIELGSTMPRGPKARSSIWEYFELVEVNEEARKAKCLHCGRVYNCHPKYYDTFGLVKHIKKCLMPHPVIRI